jgi:hypothetical protein
MHRSSGAILCLGELDRPPFQIDLRPQARVLFTQSHARVTFNYPQICGDSGAVMISRILPQVRYLQAGCRKWRTVRHEEATM